MLENSLKKKADYTKKYESTSEEYVTYISDYDLEIVNNTIIKLNDEIRKQVEKDNHRYERKQKNPEKKEAKLNKEKPYKKQNRKRLPLQCIETGVVFEQESYAKDWLKEVTGKKGNPSGSARTGGSCRGYHFKYVQIDAQKGDQ